MKTKLCPQCKLRRPYSEFCKDRSTKSKLSCWCKTCSKEYAKKYRDRKPLYSKRTYEKYKERILKRNKEQTKIQRQAAFEVIANGKSIKCAKHDEWGCCRDKTNTDFLSFDHVYGNGFRHRLKIGEGSKSLYLWIIKHPKQARKQIQIICMNAQMIKARLNREHRCATIEKPKWGDDNIGQRAVIERSIV